MNFVVVWSSERRYKVKKQLTHFLNNESKSIRPFYHIDSYPSLKALQNNRHYARLVNDRQTPLYEVLYA